MVLVGKLNKDIVLRLNRHGQPAVGLCGDDGSLFRVASGVRRGGARTSASSGAIEHVDVDVLNHIAEDYIPVSPRSAPTREGHSYNVNADEAAGAVAAALGAYKVIFLTDVEGWLADPADPATPDLRDRRRRGARAARRGRRGRHAPKLEACVERGRGRRRLRRTSSTAAQPHSLLLELFTDEGIGTKVRPCVVTPSRAAGDSSATHVMQTYARAPVEFVRGEGATL